MTIFRFVCSSLAASTVVALATPAFARGNVSDITGPNVSDITGPNVSDITGPNTSDITGPNTSDNTGTNTADDSSQRAAAAGLNQDSVRQLADDLGSAYSTCSSGGDCSVFFNLYEQSLELLGE